MPVVATAMRVSGGDVVQRAAAITDGTGRAVVVEFVNETPAPVSVALVLSGSISTARVRGSRLLVDGRSALELDRTPGGATAVSDGDIWEAVRSRATGGRLRGSQPVGSRGRGGAGSADRGRAASGDRARRRWSRWRSAQRSRLRLAGWPSVSRAASVALPEESTERAWRRGIAACLLAAGEADIVAASRAAVVLDRLGLADEADRGREMIVGALAGSPLAAVDAVSALRAVASRRLRSGRDSGLAEWAGPLVDAAGDRLDAFTLEQVAAALEREAPAAARDARRLLIEATPRAPVTRSEGSDDRARAAVRDSVAFGGDGLAGIEAVLGLPGGRSC